MSVIHISGFPREKNNQKQLKFLRLYIRRMGLAKSTIIDLFDTPDTDLVEATIEVPVGQNLYAFLDVVKKAPYKKINTGIRYPLIAKVVNDAAHKAKSSQGAQPSKQPSKKKETQPAKYNDNSNLDVELELLNKKEQLLEEQRKLLQESDKLQIMQDGPPPVPPKTGPTENWNPELDSLRASMRQKFNRAYNTRKDHDWEAYKAAQALYKSRIRYWRKHSKTITSTLQGRGNGDRGLAILSDPQNRNREIAPKKKKGFIVPLFVKPCSMLVKKCLPYINQLAEDYERQMLTVVIRSRIRRELAVLLNDQPAFLPCAEIIRLYRVKHPEFTDETFVAQQLSDYIRCSFWPFQRKPKAKKANKKGPAGKKGKPAAEGDNAETPNNPESAEVMDADAVVEEVHASTDAAEQGQPADGAPSVETAKEPEQADITIVEDTTGNVGSSENVDEVKTIENVDEMETNENVDEMETNENVDEKETNENVGEESADVSNEELAMDAQCDDDEDDWVTNGVDWVDDDDEKEDNAASNNV